MSSLRTFHIFFILVVIATADFFGLWSIWDYQRSGDRLVLGLGIASLVGGLGLIAYIVWFIRKANQAHLE